MSERAREAKVALDGLRQHVAGIEVLDEERRQALAAESLGLTKRKAQLSERQATWQTQRQWRTALDQAAPAVHAAGGRLAEVQQAWEAAEPQRQRLAMAEPAARLLPIEQAWREARTRERRSREEREQLEQRIQTLASRRDIALAQARDASGKQLSQAVSRR